MNLKAFFRGFGSALELFPVRKKRVIRARPLSDEEAIRGDWEAVGNAISYAMKKQEINSQNN